MRDTRKAPPKLVCLEGYWNEKIFLDFSVKRFARAFLKTSGTRAVIGYTRRVDWMASLVADMLFLHRFYRDPSPWRNLRRPAARRLGHTLVMPG